MWLILNVFCSGNFGDPRPPEVATDLDADFLDILVNGAGPVQETTPLCSDESVTSSEAPSPLSASTTALECTNETNVIDPLDIPFLTQQCDLTNFVDVVNDPTLSRTCSPLDVSSPMFCSTTVEDTLNMSVPGPKETIVLSDCLSLFPDSLEQAVIGLTDCELNQLFDTFPPQEAVNCESEPTTPLSQGPSEPTTCTPLSQDPHTPLATNNRKRKISDTESEEDVVPQKKKVKEKQTERRIKNNAASRVSRAKRKDRHSTIFSQVDELEQQNAKLRVEAEKLEAEISKIKKLLVERLSK